MKPKTMLLASALAISAPSSATETLRLIEFQKEADVSVWRPVHDGVMGGVSSGRATLVDRAARFEGRVSLDNNGGFASFRIGARVPDLTDFNGLRLQVRGDGQIYKLSLRTSGAWDGVSWQVPFATLAGEWVTLDLAFEDLVPTWRGRLVRDAGPFDCSSIQELGIVIADKQEGPFVIELRAVDAWRPETSSPRDEGLRRTASLAALLDRGGDARHLAEEMRGTERVLVVATPRELDASASKQLGRLLARDSDLADREIRTVQLMGTIGGRVAGRTLAREQVQALRERWQLPSNEWLLVLVGKDGEVKARWTRAVEPDEIFRSVDEMPQRQSELRERSGV